MRFVVAALLLLCLVRPAAAEFTEAAAAVRRADYGAAYDACKQQAEKGDAECQNLVAVLFRQGLGIAANLNEAIRLFRSAAEKGLAAAEVNLGSAYQNGLGVARDEAQAARWYQLAATHGDPLGELQYALALFGGRGVPKDAAKGVELLRDAANRGLPAAQLALALAFENARGPAHQPALAYTWYLIVARMAHDPALRTRAEDGQTRMILQLSGQEVFAAKHSAAQWKPLGPGLEFGLLGSRPAQPGDTANGSGASKVTVTGSGFVVSHSGDVITNNHVVEGCHDLRIVRDGNTVPAKLVDTDPAADLAVLHLPEPVYAVASFRFPDPALPGESVVVVGYPLHWLLTSEASVTTGIVSALAGVHDNKRQLQITAPVQPGNSGGPLVDERGAVIGVVVGKLNGLKIAQATGTLPENINFAVHGEEARALLDKNGIKYDTEAAGEALATPAVAARALKFTVLVQCER